MRNMNENFYFIATLIFNIKLTDNQAHAILKTILLNSKSDYSQVMAKILKYTEDKIKKGSSKQKLILEIVDEITSEIDLKLFTFSLKLYMIKDLLLQEAKLKDLLDTSKLANLDPLSLEYDKSTIYSPYSTRVNGALLPLVFFDKLENKETNFMTKDADIFVRDLSKLAIELIDKGVEPNQIFMLSISESINQSIISDSGSNYEERIFNVLTSIGINKESNNLDDRLHDKDDSSTEFDFFFELNNKTYGIGAKRTLRERYKQFIKTAQMSKVDVMIEITLGVDLTEEKVKAIRNHDVFLFVADEVYRSYKYLQDTDGIYSSKDLTIEILGDLI